MRLRSGQNDWAFILWPLSRDAGCLRKDSTLGKLDPSGGWLLRAGRLSEGVLSTAR